MKGVSGTQSEWLSNLPTQQHALSMIPSITRTKRPTKTTMRYTAIQPIWHQYQKNLAKRKRKNIQWLSMNAPWLDVPPVSRFTNPDISSRGFPTSKHEKKKTTESARSVTRAGMKRPSRDLRHRRLCEDSHSSTSFKYRSCWCCWAQRTNEETPSPAWPIDRFIDTAFAGWELMNIVFDIWGEKE